MSYRDLEDGGVLLDLESGDYHSLNCTAAAVWKLLEGEPTLRDLLAQLESMLDDPPPALQHDVTLLLERMRQAGLVSVQGA